MATRGVNALALAAVMAGILGYLLRTAVPPDVDAIELICFLGPFMRLLYRYPANLFAKLGPKWTAKWARATLHPLSKLSAFAVYHHQQVGTVDAQFDSVPVRLYVPKRLQSDGALVYFHGGGFVLFDVDTYDALTRDLAIETGMVTISVNYRVAPEHVFPAAVEDCERAVAYLLTKGFKQYNVNPNKVVLIGDSAGGNLVAVVTQRLRRLHGVPQPKLQILIYPFMQLLDFRTPSYCNARQSYRAGTIVDPESIARYMLIYLGVEDRYVDSLLSNKHTNHLMSSHGHLLRYMSHDHLPDLFRQPCSSDSDDSQAGSDRQAADKLLSFLFDPNFSPLLAEDLTHLPATLLVTCEYDPLRDEGYLYAKRLHEHSVSVAWWHLPSGFHGMFNMHRIVPLARRTLTRMADFILSYLQSNDEGPFTFPDVSILP